MNPSPLIVEPLGHLERLLHRTEGWKVHSELSDNYAAVSRISGAFGVSTDEHHEYTLINTRFIETIIVRLWPCGIAEYHHQGSTILRGICLFYLVRVPVCPFLKGTDSSRLIRLIMLVFGPGLGATLRALSPLFVQFHCLRWMLRWPTPQAAQDAEPGLLYQSHAPYDAYVLWSHT